MVGEVATREITSLSRVDFASLGTPDPSRVCGVGSSSRVWGKELETDDLASIRLRKRRRGNCGIEYFQTTRKSKDITKGSSPRIQADFIDSRVVEMDQVGIGDSTCDRLRNSKERFGERNW